MKKLVVIGGGFAGSHIARELENKFSTTLIDSKDYFEFTPGILRAIVKPGYEKELHVCHKDYLKKTDIIIGNVDLISKKFVKVGNKKIKYDYLAICAGSNYAQPFKQSNVLIASHTKEIAKYREEVDKSESIVIVGGGLVGVELAAEIAHFHPNKKITLIHASKSLVERNPIAAQRYTLSYLVERKVWVLLNQIAKKIGKKKIVTDKNFSIPADIVFLCVGIKPNTIKVDKTLSRTLDEKGNLIVNENLQVGNITNIFGAGDISSIKEEKTAQAAEKQAETIVSNILSLENGKNLKEYSPSSRPMVISLGPLDGIFVYKKFVYTGLVPAILKWFIERKTMWKFGK